MAEQFLWECETRPDYRHNPTPEEIEAEEKWWERFRASPVVQFMARAEEIADDMNKMELEENDTPYRREDRDLWRAVPRKAIKSKEESDDKFWDFMKQFLFGLWGFRQRPYPPGRPIDVAQAIGYKRLEKRYYDSCRGSVYRALGLMVAASPCALAVASLAYASNSYSLLRSSC